MGQTQSTRASSQETVPKGNEPIGSSVSGLKARKIVASVDEAPVVLSKSDILGGEPNVEDADYFESDFSVEETDDESSLYESDEEDEEAAEDEFFAERLRILEDARNLKKLAQAFLHPELPVKVDGSAMGRNFFSRPSAEDQEDAQEAEERAQLLADAAALKKLATDYAHPEVGVVTSDPTACGRNYFERASAVEQETPEEADERAAALADAAALKKAAFDYLHPEVGVEGSDPTLMGRNYFDRPSAPEQESQEEAEERAQVLADAAALKKLAVDYAHPEMGVETDATSFGRNYFDRASAPEQESQEEADERAQVLADAAALKKLAVDYAHPEKPVDIDSATLGRNYYDRASAPGQETAEEAEERAMVLAEAAALKKLAIDYAHPEKPVEVDSTACARNYFSRMSADEQKTTEEAEERAQILAEAAALKKLAADYAHPEKPVEVDSTAFARSYFERPSAPQQWSEEDAEERARILAEAAALKKLAVNYAHPEMPVEVDASSFGRNYFSRPSAPQQESEEEADERALVLAEAAALKTLAVDYAHPEKPVEVAPASFGRNYFDRPSAPAQASEEEAEESARILADAAALKKLAVNYAHPEKPVEVDPASFGRNYFDRPSAPAQASEEEAEERTRVLAEAAALKKLAVDYAHPEIGVTSTDPTAFGRNYFERPSAPVQEGGVPTAPAAAEKSTEVADDYDQYVGEEQFEALRDSLQSKNQPTGADKNRKVASEGGSDEGSLSRSPSSVMLFGYEDNHAF